MSSTPRRARVRALAKINASLKVLHRRPDGFHELRTIFQTISLADLLDIEFSPSPRTSFELDSTIDIEDNIVLRAARACLDLIQVAGRVRLRLRKRIPMGAGLGGGSSDAAAVLLALPVLAGGAPSLDSLTRLAAELGSDVPFFLLGGTALGLGRGTELHPLPDLPGACGVLVHSGVPVSTADAYRALGRELTTGSESCHTNDFQALSWATGHGRGLEAWAAFAENDFEPFVFEGYPQVAGIHRQFVKLGAKPARMSGSGSSLFGIFESKDQAERVQLSFRNQQSESFYLVSRARYRRFWWRSLMGHLKDERWLPRSRYVR